MFVPITCRRHRTNNRNCKVQFSKVLVDSQLLAILISESRLLKGSIMPKLSCQISRENVAEEGLIFLNDKYYPVMAPPSPYTTFALCSLMACDLLSSELHLVARAT